MRQVLKVHLANVFLPDYRCQSQEIWKINKELKTTKKLVAQMHAHANLPIIHWASFLMIHAISLRYPTTIYGEVRLWEKEEGGRERWEVHEKMGRWCGSGNCAHCEKCVVADYNLTYVQLSLYAVQQSHRLSTAIPYVTSTWDSHFKTLFRKIRSYAVKKSPIDMFPAIRQSLYFPVSSLSYLMLRGRHRSF